MAKKLHEGAPPFPRGDMGFKDFGTTTDEAAPMQRHRGVRPGNAAKHRKEAAESRKRHPKRV